MTQKLITAATVGVALIIAACSTVQGAGKDIQSVANCGDNTIEGRSC